MSQPAAALQTRLAERDVLLQRITAHLSADERVVAAWLHGSLGRGGADAFSDIDLWLVVPDAHSADMLAGRQAYAAQFGPVLLVQDAPHNAPAAGAFLLVMYPGSVGPIQVDWTWQPRSLARLPRDARILFDRVDLPTEPPPQPPAGRELAQALTDRSVFVWMMLQVAAKKIARRQAWAALLVLDNTQKSVQQIRWLLGLSDTLPVFEDRRLGPLPTDLPHLMQLVRSLADQMASLTPTIIEQGGEAPAAVIEPTYRLFDVADAMLR